MAWIIAPALIGLIWGYQHFIQSLPQISGEMELSGLSAPVDVVRDGNAIPHIYAKQDLDAFFALGYVHAQDRLWQMMYQRRFGQGRLSELLGFDALNIDKLMRTLGLHHLSSQTIAHLDKQTQASLQAYADGVNAWLEEGHVLPPEFSILDLTPEKWQPANSVLLLKLMALDLGQNFGDELTFDSLVKELGLDKAAQLTPNYPKEGVTVTEANDFTSPKLNRRLLSLSDSIQRPSGVGNVGVGSNAWVVSGRHTVSGLPLLSADPHLANQIPALWYLAELQGDKLHTIGATYPGVPFVIYGHNGLISWASTNLTADVQDLYVERVHPVQEDMYEVDGQWHAMTVREEWIKVKSDLPEMLDDPVPPLKWLARSTRHGPLISDAMGKVENPLAMRWTALTANDTSMDSLRNINYAQDWHEFTEAIQDYVAPALNYLYADVHGNIAYTAAGHIPIRQQGDGRLPVPGWRSDYEWLGIIPFEDLPNGINPDQGFFVSANNKIHSNDYPYLISSSWSPPYRAERITELLQAQITSGIKFSAADFSLMQGDVVSLQAKKLITFLVRLEPETRQQSQILARLSDWQGNLTEDSEGAAIFQSWLRNFNALLVKDDLRGDLLHVARGDELQGLVNRIQPVFIEHLLNAPDSDESRMWCDQAHTPEMETCQQLALLALDDAITELNKHAGVDGTWGDLHHRFYPHPVFTHVQLLDYLFDREVPGSGDAFTINVADWQYSEDKGYQQRIGPNYRQVVDMSNMQASGFITSTGQSGNILSPHYDDYILAHKNNQLFPMYFGQENLPQGSSTLRLLPKGETKPVAKKVNNVLGEAE